MRHVFTANPDGTSRNEILIDGQPTESGQWSPDSTRLAVENASGVYVVHADGSAPSRIAAECRRGFLWSPDGQTLACATGNAQMSESLLIIRADGSLTQVAPTPDDGLTSGYVWSPDSQHVAYRAVDGLRIANADGSPSQTLKRVNVAKYLWSPDGRQIAYTTNENGVQRYGLYLANADGSNERQLATYNGGIGNTFAWSPNSAQLVYVAAGQQRAYSIDVATATRSLLADRPITDIIGFANGGQTLYALNDQSDRGEIVALSGGTIQTIATSPPITRIEALLTP